MEILTRIYETWRDVMENKSDPRTRDWFMMDSPLPTIAVSAAYIIFVKVLLLYSTFPQYLFFFLSLRSSVQRLWKTGSQSMQKNFNYTTTFFTS